MSDGEDSRLTCDCCAGERKQDSRRHTVTFEDYAGSSGARTEFELCSQCWYDLKGFAKGGRQ